MNIKNSETLFNESSKLKYYTIQLDGISILIDEIIALQIINSMDNLSISAILEIKDSFGIFDKKIFDNDTKIIIDALDNGDIIFSKTFKILSTNIDSVGKKMRRLKFNLIDELSFNLKQTYLSKSFLNKSPYEAFKEIFDYYKFSSLTDKIEVISFPENDLLINNRHNFVIPQNINLLDFFRYYFNLYGLRVWQNRTNLVVSEFFLENLKDQVDLNGDTTYYFNNHAAYDNVNYIHDFTMFNNKNLYISLDLPKEKNYKFSVNKKANTDSINLEDLTENLEINKLEDISNNQITTGVKLNYQEINILKNQKIIIEDTFLQSNLIEIITKPSFKYHNVGELINVVFKSNESTIEGQSNVDLANSGKYIIFKVDDKFIGDKCIQKLTIVRADSISTETTRI